jgi:hypothetical protein
MVFIIFVYLGARGIADHVFEIQGMEPKVVTEKE